MITVNDSEMYYFLKNITKIDNFVWHITLCMLKIMQIMKDIFPKKTGHIISGGNKKTLLKYNLQTFFFLNIFQRK